MMKLHPPTGFVVKTLAALCASVMCTAVAYAQAPANPSSANTAPVFAPEVGKPMQAVRLQPGERITLDGTLSDAAWKRAPVYNAFAEIDPVRGRKPEHETRVQVMYDDQALYVGITAIDPRPQEIRSMLVRHDKVFRTQDFVVVYIDSIGSKKSAQFFRVSPSGSSGDGLHTADNDNEDFSPDYDFDAASARNDQGYTAVLRIPYTSLRYDANATGPWRIQVGRRLLREQMMLHLSAPLQRQDRSFIDAMQPLEGFTPPQQSAFLQLRPTLTARHTQEAPANGAKVSEGEIKASLDVKWRPRPELVVDATFNPDFSQVELDVPQLSRNTRFALFLNEKRPFFLESSDLLVSPSSALYTRSVNDPRVGLRTTWRSDTFAGTALLAQDRGGGLTLLPGPFGTGAALQGENTTLMSRARYDQGGVSYGAIANVRDYKEGGQNTVLGADTTWNFAPNWRYKGQVLGSRTTAQLNSSTGRLIEGAAVNGTRVDHEVSYRTDALNGAVGMVDVSKGYRNDAGFTAQNDVRTFWGNAGHNWYNVGKFNRLEAYVNAGQDTVRSTGQTIGSYLNTGIFFDAANNTEFNFTLRPVGHVRNSPTSPLLTERTVNIYAQTSPGQRVLLVQAELGWGRMNDVVADRTTRGVRGWVSATTRLLPRLELEPRVDYTLLYANGTNVSSEVATRLLGIWHLAPRQTLRLILQRSDYERKPEPLLGIAADKFQSSAQSFTYTWRKSAGTVLYVGASRGTSGIKPTRDRSNEVFVKLQVDTDDLRRWWKS